MLNPQWVGDELPPEFYCYLFYGALEADGRGQRLSDRYEAGVAAVAKKLGASVCDGIRVLGKL
jgi:hypothetical protein